MKKLTVIFIVIGLSLAAALVTPWLIEDPGYFYIRFAGYEVEMRLIVALGLLVTIIIFFWLLVFLIRLPKRTLKNYSANRSRRTFAKGLLSLSEGKWKAAERLLLTSAKNSPTPELSYMAAARAAVAQNKIETAFSYLDEAEISTDNPLTVDLTRCELWIKTGNNTSAIQLLQRILKSYPNNPRALHLMLQAGQNEGQWQLLRDIMPRLEKLEILPAIKVNKITDDSIRHQLEFADTEQQLQSVWNSLNRQQKMTLGFIKTYAQSGLRLGMTDQVARLTENALSGQMEPDILDVWFRLDQDIKHKIKLAEKWLKSNPQNAHLLMVLGELCLKERLWGKAQDYLHKSLSIEPAKNAYRILARYYDEVGEPDNALDAYRSSEGHNVALALPQISEENKD